MAEDGYEGCECVDVCLVREACNVVRIVTMAQEGLSRDETRSPESLEC